MTVNQWLIIVCDLDHTTDPCLDYRSHHVLWFLFCCFCVFVSVVSPVHGVTEKKNSSMRHNFATVSLLSHMVVVLDKVFKKLIYSGRKSV